MSDLSKRAREIVDEIKSCEELEELRNALTKRQKTLEDEKEIDRVKTLVEKHNLACSLKHLPVEKLGPDVEMTSITVYAHFKCYGIKNYSEPTFRELHETTVQALEAIECSCDIGEDSCKWRDDARDWHHGDYDDPVRITYSGKHYLYYKPLVPLAGQQVAVVDDEVGVYCGWIAKNGKDFKEDNMLTLSPEEDAEKEEEHEPLMSFEPIMTFPGEEEEEDEEEEKDEKSESEEEEDE